jgi:dTDP-4-amino-4,6-dideoxygalactose transaminase
VALMGLDIGPGDEVVTSTFSFFATAGCVARLGAKPVLVDIDPDTYNIDPIAARAPARRKTKAVHPGAPVRPGRGLSASSCRSPSEFKLKVIEDAAQAIGRDHGGVVGGIGARGVLLVFPEQEPRRLRRRRPGDDEEPALAERMRLLRNHGMEPKYYHHLVGGNFRLDALQAAVLRVKLPHLDGWTEARQRNAARYRAACLPRRNSPRSCCRSRRGGDGYHIYNQFVIRVPIAIALRAHLTDGGIGTEVYYPVPFHLQKCFAIWATRARLPACREAAAEGSAGAAHLRRAHRRTTGRSREPDSSSFYQVITYGHSQSH